MTGCYSHNSRDVILSHNLRNVTCLTLIPSHNSRDIFWATNQGTSNKPIFKVSPKYCRPHTSIANKAFASASSPCAALEPLGASRPPSGGHMMSGAKRLCCHYLISIAWRDDPHRQAPRDLVFHSFCSFWLGGSIITVRRYTSTCVVLVFALQHIIFPTHILITSRYSISNETPYISTIRSSFPICNTFISHLPVFIQFLV